MSDNELTPDEDQIDAEMAPETEAPVEDPVEILVNENAELKERLLRLAADMENLRKRMDREISDTRNYAIAGFARDCWWSQTISAVP